MKIQNVNDDSCEVEPLKGRDLRCPACDYRGSFCSEIKLACFLEQEPGRPVEAEWTEPPGYWGGESNCSCHDCGHIGMVADFIAGRPTSGLSWCEVDPEKYWVGCRPALPPLSGFAFEVYHEGTNWVARAIRPCSLKMEEIHPTIDAAKGACAATASRILEQDERSLSRAEEQ